MATAGSPRDQGIDLAEAGDFRLGTATVCPSALRIETHGGTVQVDRRIMQMLVVLHEAAGATVTKQQLVAACWAGLAVSDDAITQCVSRLRRALARVAGARIETVARVGYRLDRAPAGTTGSAGAGAAVGRRFVLAGAIAATAVLGGAGMLLLRSGPGAAAGSIAVLPFVNLSGDPREAYLADGIAEEVRTAVARIEGLKVIGRTSSEALRGHEATDVAQRLKVANVLTGSVRRSGRAVRVSTELVDGGNGLVRWARTYDLDLGDALQVETEIAQSVAEALALQLGSLGVRAIAAGGTRNAEALDLYIQAKQVMRASDTRASVREVQALCDAAIGLDGRYASAFALKALALAMFAGTLSAGAQQMADAFAEAEECARRAIAIAPQLASGHVALGRVLSGRLRLKEALAQYRQAERVAANDPAFLALFSRTLSQSGMIADGLRLAERLVSVDPLNAFAYGAKGFALFFGRDFAASIAALETSLRLAPGMTEHRNLIGDCLCLLGRYAEALASYESTPADGMFRLTGEAFVAARTGAHADALRFLARLRQIAGDAASYQRAQILAQLGDAEGALAMLRRARAVLDPGLNSLPADPFMDPLRRHPEFRALLAALRFP